MLLERPADAPLSSGVNTAHGRRRLARPESLAEEEHHAEPAVEIETAVTVVIVNHNSGEWLGKTLRRLSRQLYTAFEVIVVDNASTDGSEQASLLYPGARLIRSEANLGFAAANNLAVSLASTEWIVLLNPDAPPHRRWLKRLVREAERRPDYRIFGSQQLNASNPRLLDGFGDELSAFGIAWRRGYLMRRSAMPDAAPPFGVCGAALMLRRTDYAALGGLDERFFCYGEDVDLCYRANLRGWRSWQVNDATVYHAAGACSRAKGNEFAIYHGYRNLVWLNIKNAPGWMLPFALLGNVALTLIKSYFAKTPGARKAYLRGLRDGWLQSGPFWRDRGAVQATRCIPMLEMASRLVWNPLKIPRRSLLQDGPKRFRWNKKNRAL